MASSATGCDEPLVLLGGMGCSSQLWAGVRDRLPGVEVIEPVLDQDDLERCVEALLHALPSRFALAGLSLGGIVAMALVRHAPERVSRLALLSTNPLAPTPAQYAAWQQQRDALAHGRSARELQAELLPVLVHPQRQSDLERQVLAMADDLGEKALDAQLALQATRVDERPGLRRLAVPTLVLAAADDRLCPVGRHEEIHALVPGSRLVVLPDTGHLSALERPQQVADELSAWLG